MSEPSAEARLPAHLEVSGLVRRVNAEGGFATVLAKGEADGGTIFVITSYKGADFSAYERMPQADGRRLWTRVRQSDDGRDATWTGYLARRQDQDPDLWIVELDVAAAERFIGLPPHAG